MARLSSADVSPQDVMIGLSVLKRGLLACEQKVITTYTWYRPILPAIEQDMRWLAAHTHSDQLSNADTGSSSDSALGAAYVLVGSRLGARVIATHLRRQLGEDFVAHSQYYGTETEHALEQWSQLKEALGRTRLPHAPVCATAIATFKHFIDAAEAVS